MGLVLGIALNILVISSPGHRVLKGELLGWVTVCLPPLSTFSVK